MNDVLRVGIYLRLSKEDDDVTDESNSIINQRLLLKDFVMKKFESCQLFEFVDDGFSGTNFNRPGVSALLEKVRMEEINCILVKDFSRFSRDYIELGSYLERIFPVLGVRFISVADNYDSINYQGGMAGLDVSFKILMHDMYSKDLSLKVKSALKTRKAQGQYISGNCPFGYRKASDDRHMLLIAEDEAAIVKRIFGMAQDGKTSTQIAKILNLEKVKTPIEFKIEKKQTSRAPIGEKFLWSNAYICSILRNPIYVGDIVYNKTYRDEVGGKNHLKPRSEWKIYYNHHEAIINREMFDNIQAGRGEQKPARKNRTHPLQGKAVCGCCRKSLSIHHTANPYFYCGNRYYNGLDGCVEKVNLMFLEQYILYMVQGEIMKHEDIELAREKEHISIQEKIQVLNKWKEQLANERYEILRKRLNAYEKYVLQREVEFLDFKPDIDRLEKEITEIEREVNLLKRSKEEQEQSSWQLNDKNITKLTKDAVDQFIQQIVIYDEQHIEIEWNFEI